MLKLVAYFLRKFGGYKFADLMEEYAIRVYAMINQSLILDAQGRQEDMTIAVLPNAKKGEYERIAKNYRKMAQDLVEEKLLNKDSNGEVGMKKLKQLFRSR